MGMIPGAQPSRRVKQAVAVVLFLLGATLSAHAARTTTARTPQPRARSSAAASIPFAFGDLDRDGRPDFVFAIPVAAQPGAMRYSIRISLSKGAWARAELTAPTGIVWIRLADVSGNGALDITFSRKLTGPALGTLLNNGDGRFDLSGFQASSDSADDRELSWLVDLGDAVDGSLSIQTLGHGFPEPSCAFLPPALSAYARPSDYCPLLQMVAFFATNRGPPASSQLA